jgi:hypothetical protein
MYLKEAKLAPDSNPFGRKYISHVLIYTSLFEVFHQSDLRRALNLGTQNLDGPRYIFHNVVINTKVVVITET